ncbi:helix-turn-helix transcriptional regulator [Treponema sp. OMZ 305]|uniref:helix-turn-helix domain-containing protein n=1 Tax=Treponema sp. OMZ 305 TaxID=1659192 RepID=UPI0020A2DABA|nr:helix-turn-helix transcriptional regulator [Treponema sp. OMZ 305]UTC58862.1 helix-turn-helix transcriptional regulator [Treponema sp. OMZ 305]
MQVVEKVHPINVSIKGIGSRLVKDLVMQHYPQAQVVDIEESDNGLEKWEDTELYKKLKSEITPGDKLTAYRTRAGLSITELARLTGVSYTNISAMEANRRVIGLKIAKKLAEVLNCRYTALLDM